MGSACSFIEKVMLLIFIFWWAKKQWFILLVKLDIFPCLWPFVFLNCLFMSFALTSIFFLPCFWFRRLFHILVRSMLCHLLGIFSQLKHGFKWLHIYLNSLAILFSFFSLLKSSWWTSPVDMHISLRKICQKWDLLNQRYPIKDLNIYV